MSKKKVSGNTMTLKDFHGGSIPTDLPLPSAPGVTVRPTDRSGYDRHTSWVSPIGLFDNRSRPHSSSATRNFDEKSPFLSQTAQIGRNFDEDERKPLDGISGPRRTISDDRIQPSSGCIELKPEYGPGRSLSGWQDDAPLSQSAVAMVNLYSGRVAEVFHGGANSQHLGGKKEQGVGIGYPNAWGTSKEITKFAELDESVWSRGQSGVSKLAHASAVEKISSGRWQSKTIHYQTDVETVKSSEGRSVSYSNHSWNNAYNMMDASGETEHYEAMLARHAEKGLYIDDQSQGSRYVNKERSEAQRHSDVRERSSSYHANGLKPAGLNEKLSGSVMQHSVPSEPSERLKLKLLPRTKPLETSEPTVANYMLGYQSANEQVHGEPTNEVSRNLISANPELVDNESGKHVAYHPKLNLKPLSQPGEQWEDNTETARTPLFGGARPRELVLKERGVDDVAINHQYDSADLSNSRVEQNVRKYEKVDHTSPRRNGDRTGHTSFGQRIGRKTERKEFGVDADRGNMRRRNWLGDNRRNNREAERQQPTERQPSPDTWRKPVEESKQSSPAAVGLRYGKAASALVLSQAFSRSVSEPKKGDSFPGQRGLAGCPQVPFSRLVASTPRPQINGY